MKTITKTRVQRHPFLNLWLAPHKKFLGILKAEWNEEGIDLWIIEEDVHEAPAEFYSYTDMPFPKNEIRLGFCSSGEGFYGEYLTTVWNAPEGELHVYRCYEN